MPQAYVSLGSNIHAEANICSCMSALCEQFEQVISSAVYQSEAQGFEGAPFLNAVVGFKTAVGVVDLCDYLHRLEDQHGRQRGLNKFSSRTLDVDLLLYDDTVLAEGNLPHSDILIYPFVLLPLAEIAPARRHPVLQQTFQQLAAKQRLADVTLKQVRLDCEHIQSYKAG